MTECLNLDPRLITSWGAAVLPTAGHSHLHLSEKSSCLLSTALPPVLLFGCVVGVNPVTFLSSLHRSAVVPPHQLFRTRSVSLWMLSKCFCREPWGGAGGGGLLKAFIPLPDRCLGKIQCKEGKRQCARWLNSQDTQMLLAWSSWKQRPPSLVLFLDPQQVLSYLLGPGPSSPLIFTCCVSI